MSVKNIRTAALSAAILAIMLTACTNGNASDKSQPQGAGDLRIPATAAASAPADAGSEKPVEDDGFVGYVVRIEGGRMLVISPESQDFSANGGMSHFYEAFWFSNMPSGIEVGSKVRVWAEGEIDASYPGQGKAGRAEVLDAAKPEGATLSESEAIRKAILAYEPAAGSSYPIVTGVKYDPSSTLWTVSVASNGEDGETSIQVFDREQ